MSDWLLEFSEVSSDCISRVHWADDSSLAVSSWDGTIRIYDTNSRAAISKWQGGAPILDFCFLAENSGQGSGQTVSVGMDRRAVLHDWMHDSSYSVIGYHGNTITTVLHEYVQTGLVFTGGWDRTVNAWDIRQNPNRGAPNSISLDGGKVFAMAACRNSSPRILVATSKRQVHFIDPRRPDAVEKVRLSPLETTGTMISMPAGGPAANPEHMPQIRDIAVHSDYQGDRDGYVLGFNAGKVAWEYFDENNTSKFTFKCHRNKLEDGSLKIHMVNSVCMHPKYLSLATGGSDGQLNIWDVAARKRLLRDDVAEGVPDCGVSSMEFSPNGSMLAIGCSYTMSSGPREPEPQRKLFVRKMADYEVTPKGR